MPATNERERSVVGEKAMTRKLRFCDARDAASITSGKMKKKKKKDRLPEHSQTFNFLNSVAASGAVAPKFPQSYRLAKQVVYVRENARTLG